jgi:hypothetical protein
MQTRVARVLIVLSPITSVLLIGCVKQIRSTVPAFAQAAELTSTNVQAAFQTVNSTYNEAQTFHYAVTYNGQVDPSSILTGWFSAGSMNVRLQMLQGLKQYASELNSLTGSNDVHSLNKASSAVGASLTALVKADEFKSFASKLPSGVSDQAATAVNAIGNWLIEAKLAKDLPSLIEKMDPNIQAICTLLYEDIGSVDTDPAHPSRGSGLRQQLWNDYNEIIVSQNQYILHGQCNGANGPINCFSPDARLAEIEKLPALVQQRNAAEQTLLQVQVTIKQLAQAHTELVKAAQSKQHMTADLEDLIAEAQRLSTYYNSLASNKK